MEPTTLLFVEVFGMIALAAYLTATLVRDRMVFEGPESGGHLPEEVRSLHTTMFCPEWRTAADVAIGLDRSGPKARLHVLSCDLLLEEETCDLTCLGGIAKA
jgi:hypothetical protein